MNEKLMTDESKYRFFLQFFDRFDFFKWSISDLNLPSNFECSASLFYWKIICEIHLAMASVSFDHTYTLHYLDIRLFPSLLQRRPNKAIPTRGLRCLLGQFGMWLSPYALPSKKKKKKRCPTVGHLCDCVESNAQWVNR